MSGGLAVTKGNRVDSGDQLGGCFQARLLSVAEYFSKNFSITSCFLTSVSVLSDQCFRAVLKTATLDMVCMMRLFQLLFRHIRSVVLACLLVAGNFSTCGTRCYACNHIHSTPLLPVMFAACSPDLSCLQHHSCLAILSIEAAGSCWQLSGLQLNYLVHISSLRQLRLASRWCGGGGSSQHTHPLPHQQLLASPGRPAGMQQHHGGLIMSPGRGAGITGGSR